MPSKRKVIGSSQDNSFLREKRDMFQGANPMEISKIDNYRGGDGFRKANESTLSDSKNLEEMKKRP